MDPDRGILMPQDFIPVLEKHRRIHELDIRVLHRICETYRSMSARITVPVSINFSRLDYELCDIFSVVEEAVQARYMNTTVTDGELTSELLWENAVNHADMKFFWKDTRRRFVGVSRSFLKYYGFKSQDEVFGKTDEDMGWHIHNDPYRDEELKVLQEGMTSRRVKGNCLARGEDHEIIATKIPVFNHNGKIVGLMGSFYQSDSQITEKDAGTQARTDDLTGLLNSRGLYEVLFTYVDEYALRGRDFGRVEISIDDLEDVNGRFGYDFGDAVIREAGLKLLARCGNKAALGRISGEQFHGAAAV